MGNISLKKNISFLLLNVILLNYIFFIFILSLKVIPAFLMLLISLADSIKHNQSISEILNFSDTYITFFASVLLIFLWGKLIQGIIISFRGYFILRKFLKSQEIIYSKNYFTFINDKDIAFTAGLFKPQIYISTGLKTKLNNNELNAVLLHENFHKKEHDPLKRYIANFLKQILPFLPGKNFLVESYDVLSELSADTFVERNIKSRKPIISALVKMFDAKNESYNLMISSFSLKNDRIKILTGNDSFKYKSFYTAMFFVIGFIFINSIALNNTNIFIQCRHLIECFQTLFTEQGNISMKDQEVCLSSDSYSSKYHCMKFDEGHDKLYSEILPMSSI